MWNRSSVLSRGPFFRCEVCPFFSIGPYMCCVSSICYAYLEFDLLALIA
jgi:hypothetical protein